MIRLGGPIFDQPADPVALARQHVALGYRAAYCPHIAFADPDSIPVVERAFAEADVVIAEVGAWCNMLAPDAAKRRANLAMVTERLALADAVGARCCVDYLGTLDPGSDYGPHPANLTPETFDLGVETVRAVIDAVKPRRTVFCLEMMQWVLPDSAEVYLDFLRAVDRPAFGVHLDPVNLIVSPRQYYANGALIRRCVELLGPHIVSCHAKDIILRGELALHFDEVPPGQGNLDYRAYVDALNSLGRDVPLMLEHLNTMEEYAAAHAYLAASMQ